MRPRPKPKVEIELGRDAKEAAAAHAGRLSTACIPWTRVLQ